MISGGDVVSFTSIDGDEADGGQYILTTYNKSRPGFTAEARLQHAVLRYA